MNQVNNIGDLFWVDLKSLDVEKSKKFYREGFGWSFRNENWGHRNQTVIYSGTKRIGGLTDLRSPVYSPETEPHASIYILVNHVDTMLDRAVEAGGKVMLEPFHLPGMGRMATLQDPQGAVLSVWEQTGVFTGIGKQEGAEERLSWIVLFSREVIQASQFYQQVFDWEMQRMSDGDRVRIGIWNKGEQIGVIMERDGTEKQLSDEWIIGYKVGEMEQLYAGAVCLGAQVTEIQPKRQGTSKMAYGVGPDGIPIVLIQI
ncbi:VOC family protein [Bacillus horti]|uniref:Enzyme related to lactoylglutathione lyase n=1 Tax=Caldalkalibacillus horti TaxID=77523 RepID=A0ABT9VWB4_9BACI|nr:VOC family protein [Bacillus horti]MDQ0165292.1 putative enzyme related to lactoylglutathione lyase [Bacillus horti]